ncbi:SH3 domain-containing protein [Fulvimarina sp. 2208YS6-2-32]|uniref:SH3 domain-containing protein n=1 Tax=Fulvimarina uroteuthidis TaxID=3098149 RepID=A0ABU5I5X0_9HYPH|nr:SH3 domain-containing protein [Fulvimarina sp. 2208YS6-2-32]MDY8110791.1 SH3 domain-containing protein [Fulvimarina sp. 2208YS6-2-32]
MRSVNGFLSLAFIVAVGLLTPSHPSAAQSLDVPFVVLPDREIAGCASSVVAGLDPNGDGFLAVRTGPGTQYRKIGEVYNGEIVGTCDARGAWVAIIHGPSKKRGWVHGGWLRDLAG